jgi:hypothetical protein
MTVNSIIDMKAKLIKNHYGFEYFLADENGSAIATSDNGKLSKQNCDEIFGVVDVEKYVDEYTAEWEYTERIGFRDGFNKAMELNEDKLFTLEDMKKAFELGYDAGADMYNYERKVKEFELSLQQQKGIEVEVEMEEYLDYSLSHIKGEMPVFKSRQKTDFEGFLILKKI